MFQIWSGINQNSFSLLSFWIKRPWTSFFVSVSIQDNRVISYISPTTLLNSDSVLDFRNFWRHSYHRRVFDSAGHNLKIFLDDNKKLKKKNYSRRKIHSFIFIQSLTLGVLFKGLDNESFNIPLAAVTTGRVPHVKHYSYPQSI